MALGRRPEVISRPVGSTLLPSTDSTTIRLSPSRVTSARLPSGVKATEATSSPMATVSISLTSLPWIESTLIDLSARLATSAMSPARLIASPDGCLPTSMVPI